MKFFSPTMSVSLQKPLVSVQNIRTELNWTPIWV